MIFISLLDNDLYKFTMMQCAFHQFSNAKVQYKFVCRTPNIDLAPLINEIKNEIDHLGKLSFSEDEIIYLKSLDIFSEDFLMALKKFKLDPSTVSISPSNEAKGGIDLKINGIWWETILWEVPILAIISEVHLRNKGRFEDLAKVGFENANQKVNLLENFKSPLHISDFGTRRRYSFKWHEQILKYFLDHAPKNFIQTSNLYFAKKFNIEPVGTMAHEFIQAGMGVSNISLKDFQKHMLNLWLLEFKEKLGIALTDTINLKTFLTDFDKNLATKYQGCRHDSGDPITWGNQMIAHYKKLGINPRDKMLVFSDGLNIPKAIEIANHFKDEINLSFGIGTNITNDVGLKPLSIVIKLTSFDGKSVAKISDEPMKAICEDKDFLNHLYKTFHLEA